MFVAVSPADDLATSGTLISLSVNGKSRAYPMSVLIWHNIVNNVIAGPPVAVCFRPLFKATVVFDRRLDARALFFGSRGLLRIRIW